MKVYIELNIPEDAGVDGDHFDEFTALIRHVSTVTDTNSADITVEIAQTDGGDSAIVASWEA